MSLKYSLKYIVVVILSFVLISCSSLSYLQPKDKKYLQAKSIAPLNIPPGISSSAFNNEYPVSNHYYPESAKNVSLIPPGLMNR